MLFCFLKLLSVSGRWGMLPRVELRFRLSVHVEQKNHHQVYKFYFSPNLILSSTCKDIHDKINLQKNDPKK